MRYGGGIIGLVVLATALLAAPAGAQEQAYRANDPGGFRNVLPPGSNGRVNALELAGFLAAGQRPAHNDDQRAMYQDLLYAAPGLQPADLDRWYKDGSFGVPAGEVERRYQPRPDVTILRDRRFGVPHIYGATRAAMMFGIGYATAEDRLFMIDALRHAGRAELSSFAGGAASNRAMDRDSWATSPYTEADMQAQIDSFPRFGERGAQLRGDLDQYVAGINQYIAEAKLDVTKMPGEYAAIGRLQGPDPWKPTDIVSIATLVGGIFGKGGGNELASAQLRQEFLDRFGRRRGERAWQDFRSADDPETYTTIQGKRFPFNAVPKHPKGIALPDPGSVDQQDVVAARAGGGGAARGAAPLLPDGLGLRGAVPRSASNALVVSAAESATGRPLAVFGPQVAYFAPEILMEQDAHAPGFDARGVAFPGTNLYVQLGRGRDYAWSATSAGNDVIDTYAVDLCEPDGATPTKRTNSYRFRGACVPFDRLERRIAWQPTLADMTAAGSETLVSYRSKYGIVSARAAIAGKPVAYVRNRSTYRHEIDSAIGFAALNEPGAIKGPEDAQRAFGQIGFTFNWFYVDSEHTAFFNSGATPVRPPAWHPDLPVRARRALEWRNFDPDTNIAAYAPASAHPQAIDQPFFANWNGKQARGYRADDGRYNFGTVDRGELLAVRIRTAIKGPRKMTLTELVDAMEDAGSVDLRGSDVLPFALELIGTPAEPELREAVEQLRAWMRDGAHRRDRDRDGAYEHARAIALMDAWWPRWLDAQFTPVLGRDLARRLIDYVGTGDVPHDHLGSSFDDGLWGHVEKDLRTLLGKRVRGRFSRVYCGAGSRRRCRSDLLAALREAVAIPPTELYRDPECAAGDQRCYDEIRFRALGGVTQQPMAWVNRPTFQQVVEVAGHAPR